MYLEHYGLTGFPFQITPDHRFFFDSRPHRKAMAYLTYGLSKGEGFIVITGEVGAGKTTLMNYLLTTLEGQSIVTAKVVNTQVQADDLLRLTAAAFGIERGDLNKGLLLRALEATLARHAGAGRRSLLIVDEAQGLAHGPLEELRMLSNLQVGSRPILQICLLGQPEFRRSIIRPELDQLRQRVIASYHLYAMDAADTGGYIQHRLLQAGWRDNPRFTEEAFLAIHAHTGGIPRKINFLCDRLLLYGYLENKDTLAAEDVTSVVRDTTGEAVGIAGAVDPETAGRSGQPGGEQWSEPGSGRRDDRRGGPGDRRGGDQGGAPGGRGAAGAADGESIARAISREEFAALTVRLDALEALLRASRGSPGGKDSPAPAAPEEPGAKAGAKEGANVEEVDGVVRRITSLEQRLRQSKPSGS